MVFVMPPVLLFSMFFKLIFWQAVVAAIVIACLVAILNKTLLLTAFSQFELWRNPRRVEKMVVISHKPLAEKFRQRVLRLVTKKFGAQVTVSFETDKRLWGGVIIKVDDAAVVDFSLRDRLRQAMRW